MPRYFEIGSNTTTVKLDSQGKGSLQYKVKNVSGSPVDGRAILVSLPETNPPSGPVQKGWVKLDGPADHYFQRDEQTVYGVSIEVPAKERAAAGTYTFRLDAVLTAVPDRGDQGPGAAFTIDAPPLPEKKRWWLIPVIATLLIVIGLGVWLATRDSGGKVPDVSGKSVADAIAQLTSDKFTVDPNVTTTTETGSEPNKVFSTTPAAGTKAASGSAVHLAVGGVPAPKQIAVPDVKGKLLIDAVTTLSAAKLTVDSKVDSVPGDESFIGKVVTETPAAGNSLLESGAVRLAVGTARVIVPKLTGLTVASAQQVLSGLQLGIAIESATDPNSPAGTVIKQSPDPGSRMDSNTSVKISVTPQQVVVPALNGKPAQAAASALKAANLRLGSVTMCGGDINLPVVQQAPTPGTKLNAGASVAVTLVCVPFPVRMGVNRVMMQPPTAIPENSPIVTGLNNAAK